MKATMNKMLINTYKLPIYIAFSVVCVTKVRLLLYLIFIRRKTD